MTEAIFEYERLSVSELARSVGSTEYSFNNADEHKALNVRGLEGWELVAIRGGTFGPYYYFKRKVWSKE